MGVASAAPSIDVVEASDADATGISGDSSHVPRHPLSQGDGFLL